MGISSSADFADIRDDFDEPELTSQVIAPARARTPSPNFQSGPPPSYDSATKTKKVLKLNVRISYELLAWYNLLYLWNLLVMFNSILQLFVVISTCTVVIEIFSFIRTIIVI